MYIITDDNAPSTDLCLSRLEPIRRCLKIFGLVFHNYNRLNYSDLNSYFLVRKQLGGLCLAFDVDQFAGPLYIFSC